MWLRAISHFWFLSLWWLPKQLQTERSKEVWMSSVKPWEECLKVTNCYVLAGCCMFLRCYSSTLDSPAGSQHWEKTLDFFFSRFRCESLPSVCVNSWFCIKAAFDMTCILVFCVNYVFVSAVRGMSICFMRVRVGVPVCLFFSDRSPRLTTFII